jgi:ATP adenylyltransferase
VEHLWAPWRLKYVTDTSGVADSCIFCASADPSRDDLVLIRTAACYAILNLFPYNNGHLMIVPNRHVASLSVTTAAEQTDLMRLTRHAEMALTEAYSPQGINIGINLGRPAGAGVLDHLHVHLVPRWSGDTNFMTAIGNTRVLPEDLSATRARLKPIFARLARDDS